MNELHLLGIYKEISINCFVNDSGRVMIDANAVSKILKIECSDFLKDSDTKETINICLTSTNIKKRELEDVLVIENGIYYFSHYLTYKFINEIDLGFSFWLSDKFNDKAVELIKEGYILQSLN